MTNYWAGSEDEERQAWERKVRAGGKQYPCPTCKAENALTRHEHNKGYQCDACAAKAEAGIEGY
jgi:DNA-directed RNA polymerase subunit RPC12/RpoP